MRKIIVTVGMMLCVIISGMSGYTVQAEELATGALEMTEEERKEFLENTPEIVDVKLNEKGLALVKEAQRENNNELETIEPVGMGEEIVTDEDSEAAVLNVDEEDVGVQSEDILPVSVDVSANNTFPPIGDQGSSLSCTAWANAYYMMTNNLANVRGWDAKHNSAYWISPKWVYNLLMQSTYNKETKKNEAVGIAMESALQLEYEQGAVFYNDLKDPDTNAENWRNWEIDRALWEKALSNKMESYYFLKIYDEEKQALKLETLKKLLMDGYVVTFASYIWEFDYTRLTKDSYIAQKGDKVCYIVRNGMVQNPGYHAMTIVGYDDSIEIDVDSDGIVDTYGALKIANSHGKGSNNNGYILMAYDALLPQTKVDAIKDLSRRCGIDDNIVYFIDPKKTYTPLLLAEITMKTQCRQQIQLDFGISQNDSEEIKMIRGANGDWYRSSWAYPFYKNNEKNSICNFSGGNTLEEATFVFDLTPLVKKFWIKNNQNVKYTQSNHFYIKLTDSIEDAYATSLVKVKLIDRIGNIQKEVACNQKIANGNSVIELIDYQVLPMLVDSRKSFTALYSYPVQEKLIDKGAVK